MSPETIATLERRIDLLNLLIQLRRKHGESFELLLSAALIIIRPNLKSGREVPIGEILLDARLGSAPESWRLRFDVKPRLARPAEQQVEIGPEAVWLALKALRNYPMRLHGPLMSAILCTLEWEFGPLTMIDPPETDDLGLPNGDRNRCNLKYTTHQIADQRSPVPNWPNMMEAAAAAWWNSLTLRDRLHALWAGVGHVSTPEDKVQLSDWLPLSFMRRVPLRPR